jgi:hypothetical protein
VRNEFCSGAAMAPVQWNRIENSATPREAHQQQ